MNILAFDTAMGGGSVAVVADGALVASRREDNARALAEQLVPMIDAVLADAAINYAGLDRMGVTIGPGTFTGMRIGVATARAIALSGQLPLIGLSTFEVMAQQYLNKYLKIEREVSDGQLRIYNLSLKYIHA